MLQLWQNVISMLHRNLRTSSVWILWTVSLAKLRGTSRHRSAWIEFKRWLSGQLWLTLFWSLTLASQGADSNLMRSRLHCYIWYTKKGTLRSHWKLALGHLAEVDYEWQGKHKPLSKKYYWVFSLIPRLIKSMKIPEFWRSVELNGCFLSLWLELTQV